MNIAVEFPAVRGRKGYRMRRVISCNVQKGWRELTSKAEVVISRNIKGYDMNDIRELFKEGDPVAIYAGYNGELRHEFSGYIARVNDGKHITFSFEDEMYLLKKGQVHFNKKPCTLKDVLNAINKVSQEVNGKTFELDAVDAELGTVRIPGHTPAEVLQEIKDKFKIYSFFRNGVLVSGKIYQGNNVRHVLNFDGKKNIKSHSLDYKRADELRVKIKVTSTLRNGKILEATAGDEDGQESVFNLFGIENQAELQKKADDLLKLKKVNGYSGEVVCFAYPSIQPGEELAFRSNEVPDRDGIYYADATNFIYGEGAFIERKTTIGRMIA